MNFDRSENIHHPCVYFTSYRSGTVDDHQQSDCTGIWPCAIGLFVVIWRYVFAGILLDNNKGTSLSGTMDVVFSLGPLAELTAHCKLAPSKRFSKFSHHVTPVKALHIT